MRFIELVWLTAVFATVAFCPFFSLLGLDNVSLLSLTPRSGTNATSSSAVANATALALFSIGVCGAGFYLANRSSRRFEMPPAGSPWPNATINYWNTTKMYQPLIPGRYTISYQPSSPFVNSRSAQNNHSMSCSSLAGLARDIFKGIVAGGWNPFLVLFNKTVKFGDAKIFSSVYREIINDKDPGSTLFGIRTPKLEMRFDQPHYVDRGIILGHINLKTADNFGNLKTTKFDHFPRIVMEKGSIGYEIISKSIKPSTRSILRGAGKLAIPIAISLDAYTIYSAYKEDGNKVGPGTTRAIGSSLGGWGGAIAGAMIGAAVGGPIGAVIGGIIGGIIGSGLGEAIAPPVANFLGNAAKSVGNFFENASKKFSNFTSNVTKKFGEIKSGMRRTFTTAAKSLSNISRKFTNSTAVVHNMWRSSAKGTNSTKVFTIYGNTGNKRCNKGILKSRTNISASKTSSSSRLQSNYKCTRSNSSRPNKVSGSSTSGRSSTTKSSRSRRR